MDGDLNLSFDIVDISSLGNRLDRGNVHPLKKGKSLPGEDFRFMHDF